MEELFNEAERLQEASRRAIAGERSTTSEKTQSEETEQIMNAALLFRTEARTIRKAANVMFDQNDQINASQAEAERLLLRL